jgi:hypothetical protein
MKSQDILILLKLVSLQQEERALAMKPSDEARRHFHGWEGWDLDKTPAIREDSTNERASVVMSERYTIRGLSAELGVSKTEIGASLKRSMQIGMAVRDRNSGNPKVNIKALVEFINHGIKYVFPAKVTEIMRGIPTSFAAPVLEGQIMTAGEFIYVWPDAHGKRKGQSVTPLFKSVPQAVKKDPALYELLALVDAIRMGSPREANLAQQMFEKRVRE